MTTPQHLEKQTILDDLVNQFADPLSFFRELIQNAIDAGSGQIEVYFEFRAAQDEQTGTMIIHVDDFGEGMNREIIETKLTRLFSSAKDDDYTKIGKFGIGFVSVFAIDPDGVCVDTGRTGESWRVLFSADKTYELFALDRPVEGTQIQIIKQTDRQAFDDFVRRAREVIMHWCKHVPVPILFEGEELEAPFDIDSSCKVVRQLEGTRLVMGFVDEFDAPFGYYNRGLTLKEGSESPWPHVAFKLDSRYLEHTLTRDQILEDKNFHKAWKLLEEVATDELPSKLVDLIEEAAGRPESRDDYEDYCAHLVRLLKSGGSPPRRWHKRELIATVAGEVVSPDDCVKKARDNKLLFAEQRSLLTDRLPNDYLVVRSHVDDAPCRLVGRLTQLRPVRVSARYIIAAEASAAPSDGAERLGEQLALLLRDMGGAPEWVGFERLSAETPAHARSHTHRQLALLLDDRHQPTLVRELPALGESSLAKARHVVLNLADDRVARLARLAEREPEWAAYALIKLMLLEGGLRPELDSLLVGRAIERRKRRD